MKAKITTFSDWWEDVKNVKDIHEEDLTLHKSKSLFKKKYFSERYYADRAKEF